MQSPAGCLHEAHMARGVALWRRGSWKLDAREVVSSFQLRTPFRDIRSSHPRALRRRIPAAGPEALSNQSARTQ